jgi:tRNA(Ile)-lysidine synthase
MARVSRRLMNFCADYLRSQLTGLHAAGGCWVAYSGGVDSHAMLHALASLRHELPCRVAAVHVNHGLQEAAAAWDEHCRAVCAALDIPYVCLRVDARAAAGESREAAARVARYTALKDWLPRGDCLLTAQHRDDQAETLLLQLLRGSGVKGLAAMPRSACFGGGRLLRPLLDCSHQALVDYAVANRLNWVDDPSNGDVSLDRNFLRRETLTMMRRRWPALSATLARSARHCAEAARVLEDLAREDLRGIAGASAETLPASALLALSPPRRNNLLRHWLTERGAGIPPEAVLARVAREILGSRADAEACVRWGAWELRRYRDRLHLLAQGPHLDRSGSIAWRPETALELPGAGGVLSACRSSGEGLRAAALDGAAVSVRWRRGGEQCRPVGRPHHHALKKLFQERGIPPWERGRIPLVYVGEELAAVADLWVCDPFGARSSEAGFSIRWRRN